MQEYKERKWNIIIHICCNKLEILLNLILNLYGNI